MQHKGIKNSVRGMKKPSARAFQPGRRHRENSCENSHGALHDSLLQEVRNVELRLIFRSLETADIADGKVGQVSHVMDGCRPLLNGIAVGEDDDVAPLQ